MEKRKWLWKRRGSDKSPGGETESSGSLSSLSERYSDEQDALKEFPDHEKQSPEVTSKAAQSMDDEAKESVRNLTEKLSAALVNVSAKEELVKQHAKVAEEAIAGWEKAENEVIVLKQQLDAAVQHNLSLEVRVSHLDGALKECVRQLRHGRDEQEKIIQDAAAEKKKWESEKSALEKQLLSLQAQVEAAKAESINPGLLVRLECLEKENTLVKKELRSCSEKLEIRTIERDLSTQAAETASKQHLESFKKVTKLEAECRKVQAMIRKLNDHQSPAVSYLYVESVTDSLSDSGDRLYTIENEPSCSNSWASVLISELDQFKNERATLAAEIDMMDDFLEMEQLAALSETATKTPSNGVPRDSPTLAADDDSISQRVGELEENLEKIEIEKAEVESALSESQDALKVSDMQLKETEIRLEALHKELNMVKESKELLEFQLLGMEVEMRSMSANVDCLKKEIEREKVLSSIMEVKCYELENEVRKKAEVCGELKIKQEDLGVAADKLAECQKTIASLGKQLQSLATLEDFLIDTH